MEKWIHGLIVEAKRIANFFITLEPDVYLEGNF